MNTLDTVRLTLQTEFSDLLAVAPFTRVVLRLTVALLLGALIGWDRERRDAEAGLRTHMLVSLGAALFVLVPAEAGMDVGSLSRVVQGLVSGIGFLGAAAVLKVSSEGRIHGLTTAASIWATAAAGMSAGLGRASTAVVAALLVLRVLRDVGPRKRRQPTRAPPPQAPQRQAMQPDWDLPTPAHRPPRNPPSDPL